MDVESLINYICTIDWDNKNIKDKYVDLSKYRNYITIYIGGEKITTGEKIFINTKLIDSTKQIYKSNINYYLTKIEPVVFEKNKNLYVKFVGLNFGNSSHSTILILDKIEKKAYYIDPNGYPPWYLSVYEEIHKYIKYHAKKYELSLEINVCIVGPQHVAEDEYCANWTLLIYYLRVNTDMSINDIIKKLTSYDKETLNKLMENWTCYLWTIFYNLKLKEIVEELDYLRENLTLSQIEKVNNFTNVMIKSGHADHLLSQLRIQSEKIKKQSHKIIQI